MTAGGGDDKWTERFSDPSSGERTLVTEAGCASEGEHECLTDQRFLSDDEECVTEQHGRRIMTQKNRSANRGKARGLRWWGSCVRSNYIRKTKGTVCFWCRVMPPLCDTTEMNYKS